MLKSRDIEGEIEEQVKNSTNYSELEDELEALSISNQHPLPRNVTCRI